MNHSRRLFAAIPLTLGLFALMAPAADEQPPATADAPPPATADGQSPTAADEQPPATADPQPPAPADTESAPSDGAAAEQPQIALPDEPGAASPSRWNFEFFGRGGAHLVAANSEVGFSISGFDLGGAPVRFSGGDSASAWNYLGAGGFRLARGRSGLEVAWTFAPNPALTPSVAVGGPFGTFDEFEPGGRRSGGRRGGARYDGDYDGFRGPDSRAGLLVAQLFHEVPVFRPNLRLFVGLGGGWLRVRDDGSDRLLADGAPFGAFTLAGQGFPGGDPPPIQTNFSLTQSRDKALLGGSMGVSLQAGSIVIRPRVDAYWSPSLTSESVLTISDPFSASAGSMTISETLRPAFFLFSVDFGFRFSR